MQYLKTSIIVGLLFTFALSGISSNVQIYSQTNMSQPMISEIEIPNVMNMTLDDKMPVSNLNISYTYNGEERYIVINITHIKQNELATDDCIRSEFPMDENETAFQCISRDPSLGTSTTFCDTNTADCIQPSSRHTIE